MLEKLKKLVGPLFKVETGNIVSNNRNIKNVELGKDAKQINGDNSTITTTINNNYVLPIVKEDFELSDQAIHILVEFVLSKDEQLRTDERTGRIKNVFSPNSKIEISDVDSLRDDLEMLSRKGLIKKIYGSSASTFYESTLEGRRFAKSRPEYHIPRWHTLD